MGFARTKYKQILDYYPNLLNPTKYVGRRPITCRSGWEIKFVRWVDSNSNILEWTSEDIVIPYLYELDNRKHRYFPDFWLKLEDKEGNVVEHIIEIKPLAQTLPPKIPKRKTKQYRERVKTYIKNMNKFDAAQRHCKILRDKGRNITFQILTEKELQV